MPGAAAGRCAPERPDARPLLLAVMVRALARVEPAAARIALPALLAPAPRAAAAYGALSWPRSGRPAGVGSNGSQP